MATDDGGVVNTAVRLPVDLHVRLQEAAQDHDLSQNDLMKRAITDYLDRLLPASEVKFTR